MTGQQQQIITAFEECGMSVEDISQDQDIEELTVKATLLQFSSKYRDSIKSADGVTTTDIEGNNFNDNDLQDANRVIRQVMLSAEDDNLRLRAARYIRDDKKGRLDVLKGIGKLNINVAIFNEQLLKAREAKERSKLALRNTATEPSKTIEAELVPV